MSYTVLTDTSANLPTTLLRRKSIQVLPFSYYINGREMNCMDTEAFDSAEFYEAIRKGTKVTTSLICPSHYKEFFRSFLEAGQDILFISMSSGISGSYEKALLAADELRQEYPGRRLELVDSLGASLGEGLLALKAAKLRDQGTDLGEAAEVIRALVPRMCQIFTVDDLMHLRRTGRLSNAAAVVATMLNIKPVLKGNEKGSIVSYLKVLGRKKVIDAIAEQYKKLVVKPDEQVIGIAHADCAGDANRLIELIKRFAPPKDILLVDYEPVTGSHVGPGALALFFLGRDGFRTSMCKA